MLFCGERFWYMKFNLKQNPKGYKIFWTLFRNAIGLQKFLLWRFFARKSNYRSALRSRIFNWLAKIPLQSISWKMTFVSLGHLLLCYANRATNVHAFLRWMTEFFLLNSFYLTIFCKKLASSYKLTIWFWPGTLLLPCFYLLFQKTAKNWKINLYMFDFKFMNKSNNNLIRSTNFFYIISFEIFYIFSIPFCFTLFRWKNGNKYFFCS